MPDFLLCHELDQVSVFSSEASGSELFLGELSESMVEQIQLNPLLIQSQRLTRVQTSAQPKHTRIITYQRLIIKITSNIVHRLRSIRPQSPVSSPTAGMCGAGIGSFSCPLLG